MSAYVIDSPSMDRVVTILCAQNGRGRPLIETFNAVQTQAGSAPQDIGRALFAMNIAAVQARYPDTVDDPDNMPGTDGAATMHQTYQPDWLVVPGARLQIRAMISGYKALRGLRYQCAEGDVPQTPLFAELDAAIAAVAMAIVELSPEYDVAGWVS